MSVRLRLRRTGTRNKPSYRIVAADQRSPRDGRFIEIIGYYNPRRPEEKVDLERADYWLSNGAQPTETVSSIIERARAGKSLTPAPKPEKPVVDTTKKPAPPKKAEEAKADAPAKEDAKTEEAPAKEEKAEEPKAEEAKAEAEAPAEEAKADAPAEKAEEAEAAAEEPAAEADADKDESK